jgi:hypothetical protein
VCWASTLLLELTPGLCFWTVLLALPRLAWDFRPSCLHLLSGLDYRYTPLHPTFINSLASCQMSKEFVIRLLYTGKCPWSWTACPGLHIHEWRGCREPSLRAGVPRCDPISSVEWLACGEHLRRKTEFNNLTHITHVRTLLSVE